MRLTSEKSRLKVDELHRIMRNSQYAMVFTGAGISTSAGIPDMNAPAGIWSKFRPIRFEEFVACTLARSESWRRAFITFQDFENAKPTAAHCLLSRLVQLNIVKFVVTQNVDGLHSNRICAIPPNRLLELHGNGTFAKCLRCQARFELRKLEQEFITNGIPDCCSCGGIIKLATVSFGQHVPSKQAYRKAKKCDLFIAIGSSLTFYPAAELVEYAKKNGAQVVFLNREKTTVDRFADLMIAEDIDTIMQYLESKFRARFDD